MKLIGIRAVLLDLDNTLIDFEASAKECMQKALSDRKIPFRKEIYETFFRINPTLWKKIERKEITLDDLHRIRWNMVFSEVGLTQIDGPSFEIDFRKYLKTSGIPIEGAVDLLEDLKKKGYLLCVASNGPYEQQKSRMKAAGMDDFISHWFVSERFGVNKPAGEFFEAAMAELEGITPPECVMIGDSLSADIAGGKNFGMKTVWYDRSGTGEESHADRRVTRLSEIKEILS